MSRLGHFMKDMGGAVQNVAKATNYALNPTHLDNIASGALKTGEYVAEHPGVIKDVGVAIAKDQLKPQNLLMTGGLLAATVLTGGAAAPALAAELGEGAVAGAEGVEAGVQGARAVKAAAEAGKAARSTQKAVELGRAAEEVVEGGAEGSKWARGLEKVNDVRRQTSPIAERTHAFRTGLGEKVLSAGLQEGEVAGPVRQVAANLVQGTGGIGPTTRMAGQSENAYRMQQQVRHVNMARSAYSGAKAAPGVASAVADPEGYAMRRAMEGAKMGDTGDYETEAGGKTVVSSDVSPEGSRSFGGMVSENTVLRAGQKLQNFGAGIAASNSMGGSNAFWKGPNRQEAFGGIGLNYDWRKFQNRDVNQVTRSSNFMQGFTPLSQPTHPTATPPATPPAAATAMAKTPSKPPTLPPMQMAKSAVYSGGSESETATTPGVRVLPKSGGNNRGGQADHSSFYGSGHVYGENIGTTMTAPGPAWNENMEGSMTFAPLEQPKAGSSRKGGIGEFGMKRIESSLGDTNPMFQPSIVPEVKKQKQTLGV